MHMHCGKELQAGLKADGLRPASHVRCELARDHEGACQPPHAEERREIYQPPTAEIVATPDTALIVDLNDDQLVNPESPPRW